MASQHDGDEEVIDADYEVRADSGRSRIVKKASIIVGLLAMVTTVSSMWGIAAGLAAAGWMAGHGLIFVLTGIAAASAMCAGLMGFVIGQRNGEDEEGRHATPIRPSQGTLSEADMRELKALGLRIKKSLTCEEAHVDGVPSVPCRTDRLAAVEDMARYLEIHGYEVEPVSDDADEGDGYMEPPKWRGDS